MNTSADESAMVTSPSRRSAWPSYAVLLCGMGAVCASAYIVVSTYSPLPHWDEWAFFDHLATGKAWSLHWLWAQHNEHRFLVPKLFFLVDVQFFHGTQKFLLASIFLVQIFHIALLSLSLRLLAGLRGSAWRTGTGLIAYCLLCPTQQENLVWGMELNFVLPVAMATLSICSLLLYHRNARRWMLVVSISAAAIATWSLSSGMLLWPLLLLTAWWLRMKRTSVVSLLACAVAGVAPYLYHFHGPSLASGRLAIGTIGQSLKYFVVYFGSTWVRHSGGPLALTSGAIGLFAALIFIVRVVRRRSSSPLQVELVFLMLFCMATAAVTAAGRLHLGIQEATASRYQAFALLFWCSLGLMLLSVALRQRGWLTAVSGALLLIMLGFATQVRLPLTDARWHQVQLKRISLALITGVHDPTVLADAYPSAEVVLRDANYMRQNRLSIFHDGLYLQLGQPLGSVYRIVASDQCWGLVSSSEALPADDGVGLRLTGYAWDRRLQRPVRDLIATIDGQISGLGASVTIPLKSRNGGPSPDPSRQGWVAFVRGGGSKLEGGVRLYALVGESPPAACPFASFRE